MVKDSLISDQIVTPSVEEIYVNKKILVTGASGFIGKLLVEKLLRCCSSLSCIYVLMRSKKNQSPTERWEAITKQEVFDKLKEELPGALNKVVVIEGDVAIKGLGLTESDRKTLEDEVSVVFHSAASVRFNDSITDAILLNTRGSLEMIKLAQKMKNLMCFIYVSTTFSNAHMNIPLIEEKIYPFLLNYKTIIKLAESEYPEHLALLTSKILGKHPNTYTFSKFMAEQILNDYAFDLPLVIVRPSVVINSLHEPVPGWVDNLNGLHGVNVGVAKGVLRVYLARKSCSLDYVAVDYVVNSLIVAVWHRCVFEEKSKKALPIYNCAYGNIRTATFQDLVSYGIDVAIRSPHRKLLWYPSIVLTEYSTLFTFLFYVLQLFPALVADSILYMRGSQPMLTLLNRKIFIASFALRLFSSQPFTFSNSKLLSLYGTLSKNDQKIFFMIPPEEMTIKRIINIAHEGTKKFIFKDKESDMPRALSSLRRFYWADRILRFIICCIFLWILYTISKSLIYSVRNKYTYCVVP